MQQILIVTGLSGAGKSSALNVLEDTGYYCIDNLPLLLLPELVEKIAQQQQVEFLALGVDVRSTQHDFVQFEHILSLLRHYCAVDVIYITAELQELIARFNLSRRPHPLAWKYSTLSECIEQEKHLLSPIQEYANLHIDTTDKSVHDIKYALLQKLNKQPELTVIIQSFGFKYGVPLDTDFVFDVRHLPNPHWNMELRPLSGLDEPVQAFLSASEQVNEMVNDVTALFSKWLPNFAQNNRHYVTLAIGCTGGQHRSVYMVEQLKQRLQCQWTVQVLHREQKRWIK